MRRVNINGNLSLMDYCTAGPQYASGGFIADSKTGSIINGSQQQFLVRDSSIGTWSNGVWNQVFAGVEGAPAHNFGVDGGTSVHHPAHQPGQPGAAVPVSRFGQWLRPDRRLECVRPEGQDQLGRHHLGGRPDPGRSIPLSQFFVAKPSDSVSTINSQLARGKNLIFTPGVYNIGRSIQINRPDTIVLGLGIATLTAVNGAVPIKVGDVKGVDIAGIMIDAGTVNSPALLQIGNKHDHRTWRDRGTAATRRTRPRCRTCSSGSAGRTSERPPPA